MMVRGFGGGRVVPYLPEAILGLVLVIAAATDWRSRKVYNWLTFPAMLLGLAVNMAAQHWPGLAFGAAGLAVGGLIFFPAYYWGGMGAGDIKLMAAVGAMMGWVFAVDAALYTALIGGLAAVAVLIVRRDLPAALRRLGRLLARKPGAAQALNEQAARHALPYAPIIAAGALAAYFLPSFLAPR